MRLNPFGMSAKAEKNLKELVEQRSPGGPSFQSAWASGADATFNQQTMSMEGGMQLGSVQAATSLIIDTISTFPLESLRTINNVVKPMTPAAPLVANPTVFGTRVDWIRRCIMSLVLRGNAFGYITARDTFGYPLKIEWLHPDEVSIRTDRSVAPPQWFWLGKPIPNEDFVHIPMNAPPGRILGLSPLRMYAATLRQGLGAQQFGIDYFRNGTVPAGMLTTDKPLRPGDADTMAVWWRKQAAGRGTPVMGEGLKYQQISIPADESQFLETMKVSATTIAAIYHLPPEMVGGESHKSITYTNVDGWPITLARFALAPYCVAIEEALFQYMPRPQSVRFDMDAFQRPDMAARYAANGLALQSGWKTVDEVRQEENLAPLGGKMGGLLSERDPVIPPGKSSPDTDSAPKNDTPALGKAQGGPPAAEPKNTGVGKGSAVEGDSGRGVRLAGRNGHRFVDPRDLAVAIRERRYEE